MEGVVAFLGLAFDLLGVLVADSTAAFLIPLLIGALPFVRGADGAIGTEMVACFSKTSDKPAHSICETIRSRLTPLVVGFCASSSESLPSTLLCSLSSAGVLSSWTASRRLGSNCCTMLPYRAETGGNRWLAMSKRPPPTWVLVIRDALLRFADPTGAASSCVCRGPMSSSYNVLLLIVTPRND